MEARMNNLNKQTESFRIYLSIYTILTGLTEHEKSALRTCALSDESVLRATVVLSLEGSLYKSCGI